jgi:hypothetical protein
MPTGETVDKTGAVSPEQRSAIGANAGLSIGLTIMVTETPTEIQPVAVF